MFIISDSDNEGDIRKGILPRGNLSDLQVWVVENVLNVSEDAIPYASFTTLVTMAGILDLGIPITTESFKILVETGVRTAESVSEEVREEKDAEEGEG